MTDSISARSASDPDLIVPDPAANLDVLLSQRFIPEVGGSITWMHQAYQRWPTPVHVVTHDYYAAPPRTPECPGTFERPDNAGRDHVQEANLRMHRIDWFLRDWGLQSARQWRRYLRGTHAVWRVAQAHGRQAARVRVHCTHALPEALCVAPLRAMPGRDWRVICYAHGEEVTACALSRQLAFLMRRALRHVDLVIANSSSTRALLEPYLPTTPGRPSVQVIHPGVRLNEFDRAAEDGRAWRAANGLDERTLMILTMGRIDPRKNHAAVIRSLRGLSEALGAERPLVYVIAGVGRARPALEALARERGVSAMVRFLGGVSAAQRVALFGACDVFAMPGVYDRTDVEGFGIVFVEAGACGKACVAGKVGGQPEAVEHARSGWVVDGTDDAAVSRALRLLLNDATMRRTMGLAGRARAEELDWSRVAARTVACVEALETQPNSRAIPAAQDAHAAAALSRTRS